jgi:hypothetical protein
VQIAGLYRPPFLFGKGLYQLGALPPYFIIRPQRKKQAFHCAKNN